MFNYYARILEHVPRWSIVPTLKQQYVASHSYFVSLYVAELIDAYYLDWSGEQKYTAVRAALVHDFAESRMGDMPGPVKRSVTNNDKRIAMETAITQDAGYGDWKAVHALPLIKVADLIDEYFYMYTERMSGNVWTQHVLPKIEERLYKAIGFAKLPPNLLNTVRIEAGHMNMFEGPRNDSDLSRRLAPARKAKGSADGGA